MMCSLTLFTYTFEHSVLEYLHITERISEPRCNQYTYAYLSYMEKFVVTQVIARTNHSFIYYSCVKLLFSFKFKASNQFFGSPL